MWLYKGCVCAYDNIRTITYYSGTPLRRIGEITFVLYKEVSFIQGFLNYFLICHIIARREIKQYITINADAVYNIDS